MTDLFAVYDDADIRDLIAEYPLAWLCAADGLAEHAAQLPLLGEYDASGTLTHLLGHIPRRSPLVERLSQDPRTLVLFQGPQAYISPDHAGVRNWAPTWNFAHLRIDAELVFLPDETDGAIAALVDRMEEGRARPWRVEELGARYSGMAQRVVGFRAKVLSVTGRFKLGQDEHPEVFASIMKALDDARLAAWMRRFAAKSKRGE